MGLLRFLASLEMTFQFVFVLSDFAELRRRRSSAKSLSNCLIELFIPNEVRNL